MKTWVILLLIGTFFALGGLVALINPFAASIAVTTLVGIVFLFGGAAQLWSAFNDTAQPHRGWNALIGVLALIAGVALLANPLGGMISLVALLAALFTVTGLARLAGATTLRGGPFFWPVLLSGAVSLLLGILIFIFFPETAGTLLGVLLGFELITEGAALIALSIVARRAG